MFPQEEIIKPFELKEVFKRIDKIHHQQLFDRMNEHRETGDYDD